MDELRIRTAGAEDVGVLAALMTDLGYPSSVEDMRRRFGGISSDPSYETFVVESCKEVVGMVGIRLERTYEADGSSARLMALVVSSEHRGRGAGRALISAAEEWARQRGAESIVLSTHKRRSGAHRFYRSMGYEATGYRFVKSLGQPGR
jgi:GNAT superfamily N-acetyltransferase